MSPKNLDLPSISAGEYDAKMAEIEKEINQSTSEEPAPEPTPEERIAALEEELAAAKILLGLEE